VVARNCPAGLCDFVTERDHSVDEIILTSQDDLQGCRGIGLGPTLPNESLDLTKHGMVAFAQFHPVSLLRTVTRAG
jgi:hypothetical protein